MGYESRIYVVYPHKHEYNGNAHIWAEKLACMDLAKMGYENGWRNLFKKDIEYKLYVNDTDTEFDTDMYGEHLKSCPIQEVINWLEKEMERSDYRRLKPLYALLKAYDPEHWGNDIEVVHFGY